jgi:glutaredoxin
MENEVRVYVSDNCDECDQMVALLDKEEVVYELKNISRDKENLRELQKQHVYATPALIVKGKKVLGFQEQRIKQLLNRLI